MYWILAAAFLVIALFAPKARPVGLIGLVVLGALLGWGVLQRMRGAPQDELPQRGRPTSPATVLATFPLEELRLEDMQLTGGGAPFELRGAVVNRSASMQLRSITIHVTRRDCFEGALDPSGCVVIWQDRHWLPITAPPGERRDFSNSIWMRGSAPRPRGKIEDSFELIAGTGEQVREENSAEN